MTTMYRRRIFKVRHQWSLFNLKYQLRAWIIFAISLIFAPFVWMAEIIKKHWNLWIAEVLCGALMMLMVVYIFFLGLCQNGCA